MASRLFGAARAASEYVRNRMGKGFQPVSEEDTQATSFAVNLASRLRKFIFGRGKRGQDSRPQTGQPDGPPRQYPPIPRPPTGPQTGTPTPPPRAGEPIRPFQPFGPLVNPPEAQRPEAPRSTTGNPPTDDDYGDELGYGDIQLLGRDASYDLADWQAFMDAMRLTPGSSNVFGYYFERESRTRGILYVTFKANSKDEKGGPGQTYAYYDVPVRKWHQFDKASAASAGKAVWDYLRVRGTIWGHQHRYRLVQSHGDYVPRKATPQGYRNRAVLEPGGIGRRSYRRNTLPEQRFDARGKPNRGRPDRGEPNRGAP